MSVQNSKTLLAQYAALCEEYLEAVKAMAWGEAEQIYDERLAVRETIVSLYPGVSLAEYDMPILNYLLSRCED